MLPKPSTVSDGLVSLLPLLHPSTHAYRLACSVCVPIHGSCRACMPACVLCVYPSTVHAHVLCACVCCRDPCSYSMMTRPSGTIGPSPPPPPPPPTADRQMRGRETWPCEIPPHLILRHRPPLLLLIELSSLPPPAVHQGPHDSPRAHDSPARGHMTHQPGAT